MRAILIGSIIAILTACLAPFLVLQNSFTVTDTHLSILVVFLFFFLLLGNALLRRFMPRFALRTGELVIVFIMALVAITVSVEGLVGYLISHISGPYYYASGENRWETMFFGLLPERLMVTDMNAIKWFYNGIPPGQAIPWWPWLKPLLFGWMPFLAALFLMMYCAVALLHRHWSQRERLSFPLMELPTQLVTVEQGKSFPDLFKSKAFWISVAITALFTFIDTQNGSQIIKKYMTIFMHSELSIDFRPILPISEGITPVIFPVVAFAYFVNVEILFSLWFFQVIFILIRGVTVKIGLDIGKDDGSEYGAITGYLGAGGFIAVIIFGLWMARHHLKRTLLDALLFRKVDDEFDCISRYRFAAWGFVLSVLGMVTWLTVYGMTWYVSILMVVLALVIFLGVTKVVCEGGLIAFRGSIIPQPVILNMLGVKTLGAGSLVSLAMSSAWILDLKALFATAVAHGSRLKELFQVKRGLFAGSIAVSLILAIFGAYLITLYMGFSAGSSNFIGGAWVMRESALISYNDLSSQMRDKKVIADVKQEMDEAKNKGDTQKERNLKEELSRFGPNSGKMKTLLLGAAIGLLIVFMRQHFYWWPLHPIGWMAGDTWMSNYIFGSIFVVWVIKAAFLKFGGVPLFRKGKPVFLGMVFGANFGMAFGFAFNQFFGFMA